MRDDRDALARTFTVADRAILGGARGGRLREPGRPVPARAGEAAGWKSRARDRRPGLRVPDLVRGDDVLLDCIVRLAVLVARDLAADVTVAGGAQRRRP